MKRSSGFGQRHEFWQVSHLVKQSTGTGLAQGAALLFQRAISPDGRTSGNTCFHPRRRVLNHQAALRRHVQVLRRSQIDIGSGLGTCHFMSAENATRKEIDQANFGQLHFNLEAVGTGS